MWVVAYAPLRALPDTRANKILNLPVGSIVARTGEVHDGKINNVDARWVKIVYVTGKTRYEGWLYDGFLERYHEEFPTNVVSIQNPTIDPHDAAQYMVWRGRVQYNMCGQLCVCYITGNELEALLSKWELKSPGIFSSVFGGTGIARGTNIAEVDSMLSAYGYPPSLRLDVGLRDQVLDRPVVTPGRMDALLSNYQAIASVKINKLSGNLERSGILHWVVVERVIPDGVNRGWVELYNPFPNRMQRYSWGEFLQSMGTPYGLLVKREINV